MSVKITVHGADRESDEYKAALRLKKILQDGIPNSADGEIVLFSSATLAGQTVKDVDILMLGMMKGYSVKAEFPISVSKDKTDKVRENVEIRSFLTVIEVKKHDITGISLKGTDIKVKYGNSREHSVTNQSEKQKQAAKAYFESFFTTCPFISNLIWFTQVSPNEIKGLLSENGKRVPSNVLGAEFSAAELMQQLILNKTLDKDKETKSFVFDSNYGERSIAEFQRVINRFSKTKEQMGELTRKRIELISGKELRDNSIVETQGKVSVYIGRAGTGKTIGLIQTAIRLVDEKRARVLILTYNKALVLDIQRLFALADLPDLFDEKCVFVNTLDDYFMKLAGVVSFNGDLQWDEYNSDKENILNDLKELMDDEEGVAFVREEVSHYEELDWDYLFIDEAQDWSNAERDIVLRLFDKGRIVIADGVNQFVRRQSVCDWSIIRERNDITLKECRRQKENLISFLNAYTAASDIKGTNIVGSGKMYGGKVIITTDDKIIEIHKQQMEQLKGYGNIPYDMLYLVPHRLVKREGEVRSFEMKEEFEENGIHVWDGTYWKNRNSYDVDNEEVRVLQYDSARGLEGWTVVCMDFDIFLEEKRNEYKYFEGGSRSLMLESSEEKIKKFLYNWAMIPLTRAIDTLVITLKDPDSEVGKMLHGIAKRCEDYVYLQ